MRVLHVIPSIGPLRGGPSIALGVMARALRDAGVQVDVATTNDNDRELLSVPLGTAVDEEGVRYWYFERTAHPYTTSAGLARWLRGNTARYEVVHTHALFSFATSVAAGAARKSRVPYIVRPLGTLADYGMQQHALLKRASWYMLERRILKHAAGVHFTSEAESGEAARLGTWRSFVVPLGVAPFEGSTGARDEAAGINYLFLARLHPKKRVDLLLQAFAQLPPAQTRLTIAGSGEASYVEEMRQLAAELGIAGRVVWTGHVTGREKTELLEQAHVFVLPSTNENFGIAAVEALAAGLPVVVSRGVAIHREVEAYGAGIVVDDNADSVAAALAALSDAGTRQALRTQAKRLADGKFSIAAMQRGLLDMYQQVTA